MLKKHQKKVKRKSIAFKYMQLYNLVIAPLFFIFPLNIFVLNLGLCDLFFKCTLKDSQNKAKSLSRHQQYSPSVNRKLEISQQISPK